MNVKFVLFVTVLSLAFLSYSHASPIGEDTLNSSSTEFPPDHKHGENCGHFMKKVKDGVASIGKGIKDIATGIKNKITSVKNKITGKQPATNTSSSTPAYPLYPSSESPVYPESPVSPQFPQPTPDVGVYPNNYDSNSGVSSSTDYVIPEWPAAGDNGLSSGSDTINNIGTGNDGQSTFTSDDTFVVPQTDNTGTTGFDVRRPSNNN